MAGEKIYQVKADIDPAAWYEAPAEHSWAAATSYCGWCVVRAGDRVVLGPDDIIEIRLEEKKVRVPKKAIVQWANWKSEQNIQERRKLEQERRRWRDPRAGPEIRARMYVPGNILQAGCLHCPLYAI